MATPVNVNDVLDGHVVLDVDCLDRMYLNAYVPNLQVGGQIERFCDYLGQPIASPAVIQKIGNRFRREVKDFARRRGIPVLQLKKPDRSRWDDRKVDHVRPHLERAERKGRFGVVAIVAAQEFQWVFGATKRRGSGGGVWFDWSKSERRVGTYYFYIRDADFGLGFIKICSWFPYPAKVWCNGHEWAKNQARRQRVAFRELANGFASCEDAEGLQDICDRFGPDDVQAFFERWMAVIPTPLTAADRAGGWWWELSMRQVEVSRTIVFDDPRRGPGVLRVPGHRQRRRRPPPAGVDGVRSPAPPSHQAPLRQPHLCRGHRGEHRLPVQALEGQAVPEGGEGASHRDRHQQAVGHRRPGPNRAPARAGGQGAPGQPPAAYDRTCRSGLCHRLCAVRAHPPALQPRGPENRSPALR
jgi:hypothetical protein